MPSSRRRKNFMISRSPKLTELLLCSTPRTETSSRVPSGPCRRANALKGWAITAAASSR